MNRVMKALCIEDYRNAECGGLAPLVGGILKAL